LEIVAVGVISDELDCNEKNRKKYTNKARKKKKFNQIQLKSTFEFELE